MCDNAGLLASKCGTTTVKEISMVDQDMVISERRKVSEGRLEEIRTRINSIEILKILPGLCIYVNGSFVRLEASEFSDIDLFFINKGSNEENKVPRLRNFVLDAELIRIIQDLGIPEFSKEGEYLDVHYIEDMLENLGGRRDDYENHFTGRLLLLLEGRCVYNGEFYNDVIKQLVCRYFRIILATRNHSGRFSWSMT